MTDIYLGSLAAAPIIMALIQVAKGLGFPPRYAVWLNAVLSMVAYAIMLAVEANPDWVHPLQIAVNVLVTFLAAAGAYDIARQLSPAKS